MTDDETADRVRWIREWAVAMVNESANPQYGHDVLALLDAPIDDLRALDAVESPDAATVMHATHKWMHMSDGGWACERCTICTCHHKERSALPCSNQPTRRVELARELKARAESNLDRTRRHP